MARSRERYVVAWPLPQDEVMESPRVTTRRRSVCIKRYTRISSVGVPSGHPGTELGEVPDCAGRAGVVRAHAMAVRGKAERQRDIEFFERGHLAVEPGQSAWAQAISPAQARPQLLDTEFPHPFDGLFEPVVLKMEPLADAQFRAVFAETPKSALRSAVFANQTHIKMAIIGRAFGLPVASGGGPGPRQVKQTIPVDSGGLADQQFRSASQSEFLDFFRSEAGRTSL